MLARCLLSGDSTEEVRIFYSYSREDSGFRSSIDEVLSRFKWDVDVRTWYDGEIPAGMEWEKDIFHNIDAADIVLLFITKNFASSPYCRDIEVPRALSRHERGEATVIPVLVEDIDLDKLSPPLKRLQFLPRNGRPVRTWADQDEAIRNVVQGIVDIIASATLDPAGRCRWRLRLRSTRQELDDQLQLKVVQELRTYAGDESVRPLAIGEGSIVVLVESSRAGLTNFKSWYREQPQPKVAGLDLLEVVELYGAGIQASASEVGGEHPQIELETDLLLSPSEHFEPSLMDGITIPDDKPLTPDFLVGRGDLHLEAAALSAESSRLVDYFLTAVAVPEDELWVNLSPDESNRMLGRSLAGTELGRRLLESDLRLKRLAASLMHPDCDTGHDFWKEVFDRSRDDSNVDHREFATFQRVWIVPQDATVWYSDKVKGHQTAIVIKNHNKIMCEGDYLLSYANNGASVTPDTNDICTAVFKEIILPVIEKDVNEGENFSDCQQIYNSMILATWLKKNVRDFPSWAPYIDTGNPTQLTSFVKNIGSVDLEHVFGPDYEEEMEADGVENEVAGGASGEAPVTNSVIDDCEEEVLAMAVQLREAGRNDESLQLLRELVDSAGRDRRLGWVQTAMIQLGRTLRTMGRLEDAKQLHAEVLRDRRYMLGDNHPETITSMGILADTMESIGEMMAAQELRDEIEDRKARTSEAFSIRENREFYEEYMRFFRNGVFQLTRNEYRHDRATSKRISRSYFSGAIDLRAIPLSTLKGSSLSVTPPNNRLQRTALTRRR